MTVTTASPPQPTAYLTFRNKGASLSHPPLRSRLTFILCPTFREGRKWPPSAFTHSHGQRLAVMAINCSLLFPSASLPIPQLFDLHFLQRSCWGIAGFFIFFLSPCLCLVTFLKQSVTAATLVRSTLLFFCGSFLLPAEWVGCGNDATLLSTSSHQLMARGERDLQCVRSYGS